jgi:hypothetical protein
MYITRAPGGPQRKTIERFDVLAFRIKQQLMNRELKNKTMNGTSLCFNPDCPSYMLGCNSRNRDVQPAINIAIAGMTTMLTGSALPLFSAFKTSHFYAGVSPNRGPSKDVLQVPDPAGIP